MDGPVWLGAERGRRLRRGSRRSGVQQTSGTLGRMMRVARGVVRPAASWKTAHGRSADSSTFSSRKRGKVCRPSPAISPAASFQPSMAPGPPPAPSAPRKLLPTNSPARRSKKPSMRRDFNFGAWPSRPKRSLRGGRAHAVISRRIPRIRARVFALGRREQIGTAPPSPAGNGADLAAGRRGGRRQPHSRSSTAAQRKSAARKITAALGCLTCFKHNMLRSGSCK